MAGTITQGDPLERLADEDLDLEAQKALLRQVALETVTPDLLARAVNVMRARMRRVDLGGAPAVDLVGTGGDRSGTFNISTTATLVAAAAGTPMAKHGNASISSKSGGFDLLSALGVAVPETPEEAAAAFHRHGLVFLFAPAFHPAFKRFGPARKALAEEGVVTLFNILGPLLNPAGVERSVIGVFRRDLVPIVAQTLVATGTRRALVVHGAGLDELALHEPSTVAWIEDGTITEAELTPQGHGLAPASRAALAGGTAAENAAITRAVLEGTATAAQRDAVLLNAAAAIWAGSDAPAFEQAIERARQALASGQAAQRLREVSR